MSSHHLSNDSAEYERRDAVQEEKPQLKRGRKKRENVNSKTGVNFVLSWDLDARLDLYVATLKRKEHRKVDRSQVVERVLDEFLTKEGFNGDSENS